MPSRCLCIASALGLILGLSLLGCSGGGGGPLMPDMAGTDVEITPAAGGQAGARLDKEGNHALWGLWLMNVNEDHTRIEPIPLREAGFHFNVVGYLENPPGTQLIRVSNPSWTEDDTLMVDIQLIHPFGAKPALTGFDVRGIAILPATKLFVTEAPDVDGDPAQIFASRTLVNADGYTTHWNRWTAKQVAYPKIMGYIRGRLATQNELFIEGNLHGYRDFYSDKLRRVFESNSSVTRPYEFDFPPGPLTFAYAVDACWEPPINTPVTDIFNDFPISANCGEPYQMSASVYSNSLTKLGGSATVQFDVFDWQDATNFADVHVEAPDLFMGTLDPGPPIAFPTADSARYEVVINNTLGHALTAKGGSDLLVVVEDVDNSTTVPAELIAYNIFKLPVADVPAFWRDRHGDGSFINKPLKAPLLEPSSLSVGQPDIAIVSRPQEPYAVFNGNPEVMLFDDEDEQILVYNRTLSASWEKAGYPFDVPPSWLLYPHCMDSTNVGWYGVGSTNQTPVTAGYQVRHLINMFKQSGVYGYSWHTGTNIGPNAHLETVRDATAAFGSVVGDPIFGLFGYQSGTPPSGCSVLEVAYPYVDPFNANTFRTVIPRSDATGVPGAIYQGVERLRCGIDTDPPEGATPGKLYYGFYVVETNPTLGSSELEGFIINFINQPSTVKWSVGDVDIKTEFPGAWALDCEVVPSFTDQVITVADQSAQYNWLCVLMRDTTDYWLAFYDPLNPSPDNPGHNPLRTIYTSNKIPISAGGPEPVALDVDHQFFEVYVLCRDPSDDYYVTVFEFFY